MKILVLSDDFPPLHGGGAGAVAFNVARAQKMREHDVCVVTTVRRKEDEGTIDVGGLSVIRIASSYPLRFQSYVCLNNIPVVRRIREILAEFKPDIVHAHNIHGYISYQSLVEAKKAGARVFLTCHDVMSFTYSKLDRFIDRSDLSIPGSFDYRVSWLWLAKTYRTRFNPFRNMIIRSVLRTSVDKVIAVSDALKQALNQNGIDNVSVIHNGVDAQEWEEPAAAVAEFKKKHALGDKVVLFAGRLTGIKGGWELIEAIKQIRESQPSVQLLVLGKKDASAEKMLSHASASGVENSVIFAGWMSGHELRQAYHASSVVAAPSLCFDSFPTMNIEAMACGKPVVATCFGGSRESVVDGVTGYIVNPFNISDMADKIGGLLSDEKKRAAFGAAGRQRLDKEFSLDRCAAAYEETFSEAGIEPLLNGR